MLYRKNKTYINEFYKKSNVCRSTKLAVFDVVILQVLPVPTYSEFISMLHLVSKEKQKQIKQFHFFQDALCTLFGAVLVRSEIYRTLGSYDRKLIFSTNDFGKPFLANESKFHFNISHTENYVACVIADEPVGIDIENITSINLKIAKRCFTPEEVDYVTGTKFLYRFFEVWTKKESRLKMEGKGLSKPLSSFSVFDLAELDLFNYFKVLHTDDVICHVCSSKKEKPTIRIIDTATVIRCIR